MLPFQILYPFFWFPLGQWLTVNVPAIKKIFWFRVFNLHSPLPPLPITHWLLAFMLVQSIFLSPDSGRLFCVVMTEDVSHFAVLSLAIKISLFTFIIYVTWLRAKRQNTHGCFPGRDVGYFSLKYSDTLCWHVCSTQTGAFSPRFKPSASTAEHSPASAA
jgi:hypothetical protein